MGQCARKLSNLLEETEPAPHSYKASIRAKETAKATHKGNLLLTETEMKFYENKKQDPLYEWEYQFIRKYHYERKIFSIHAGTRSKTGEGQFLFTCRNAEQLGNELEQRITAMKTKQYHRVKPSSSSSYSKRKHNSASDSGVGTMSSHQTHPSSSHMIEGDGPQMAYENLPLLDEGEQNYVNVLTPPPAPRHHLRGAEGDRNDATDSYIMLEQNPTGSMSPRLTQDPRPDNAPISYTEVDIFVTKAMEEISQKQ